MVGRVVDSTPELGAVEAFFGASIKFPILGHLKRIARVRVSVDVLSGEDLAYVGARIRKLFERR